jgi:hypothetical protein
MAAGSWTAQRITEEQAVPWKYRMGRTLSEEKHVVEEE